MKTYARKLLAVILSVVMTISALSVAFVGFTFTASAKALTDMKSRLPSVDSGDSKFVVPEQIYLYPDGMSWRKATSTPYLFYVNNDSDGNTTQVSGETTGKIYATFPADSGTLTVKAVTSVTGTMNLGGSTSINYSSKLNGSSWTVSPGTIDITGGQSISLAFDQNGYYLLWTLTYTDKNDNKEKVLTNMTYVYKPYTVPIIAGAEGVSGTAKNGVKGGLLTWISGFHSMEQMSPSWYDGGDDFDRCSHRTGDYSGGEGLAGFITEGTSTAYSNSTQLGVGGSRSSYSAGVSGYADRRYVTFGNNGYSDSNKARMQYAFNNKNFDNDNHGDWDKSYTGNSYPYQYYNTTTNSWTNLNNLTIAYHAKNLERKVGVLTHAYARANMQIDTSRYTNLAKVPNVAVAMAVTNDSQSESNSGKWFVSDASWSNKVYKTEWWSNFCNQWTNNRGDIIAGQGYNLSYDYDDPDKRSGIPEGEGLRYAGAWPHTFTKDTTGTEYLLAKAGYGNWDRDNGKNWYGGGICEIEMSVTKYSKSKLRAAVNNANKQFARFGVTGFSGGKLTSCYFDDSVDARYKWTAFSNAYLNAIQELANLFGGANADAYATALTNAMTALQTYYKFENGAHGTVSADRLTFTTIGANNTKTITLTSAPNVTPDTGYKFEGKWSTNKDAKYSDDSLGTTVKIGYNNSIYPIFTPKEFTITLNPAPGTLQGPNQFKATFDAKPDNVSVPTRTGYTFTGWYGTVNNVQVKFFDNKGVWANPEGNKVWKYATGEPALLRAGWEAVDVTLRFHTSETQVENVTTKVDANGNTVPLKFDDTYDIHQFTTTPSKTPVSEHHYIFTGKWYTDSGLKNEFDGNLNNAVIDLYPGFHTGLHNEQEVVITQPRKCYDTGTEDHYCSICHFKVREGVVIDAIGHHDLQTREEARAAGTFQDATCYQEGWVTVHCKYCYDASTDPRANYPAYHCDYDETIDKEVKKAHNWAKDATQGIYKQFSCTGNTIWYAKCINPGCTATNGFWEEPGTKLTHNPKNTDWVIVPGHEATCEQTGLRYKVCQNVDGNGNFCGAHLDSTNRVTEGEVYGPLGHKWQDSDLTDPVALTHCQKVPTCHTVGVYYRYCPQCGKYADDESFNGRYNAQIFSGTELDYDNHNGDTRREGDVRATCVSTGKFGRTYCYGCNSFYGELGGTETDHILDIDSNAHVHGTHGDDYIAPMCDTLGYSGNQRCNDCNAVLQTGVELPMDPNNHNPERLEYNHNHVFATCEEYGTTGTTYCTHCQVDVAMGNRIKPIGHHGGTYIVGAIRATCVQDGYSGDVYCNTCKKLIKYGEMLSMDKANHTDNNGDGVCDLCGVKYKDGDERWDPDTDINPTPDDDYGDCSCDCHKNLRGIRKFFWNIKVFFWKVFKMNKFCKCGREHYLS